MHIICDKMGLPNCESTIFSHFGRSLHLDSSFEAEKFHLSTIQVSMALPGGSRTPVVESNPHDSKNGASASRSEALNKFIKLMSSLSLSETETEALADRL